jgi:hypothetical protein
MNEQTVTGSMAAAVAAVCVLLGTAGCSSSGSSTADTKSPAPGSPAPGSSDTDGSTVGPADAVTGSADAADDDAAASSSCQTGGLPTDTYTPNLKKIGRPASGDSQGDAGSSGAFTFVLESDEVADAASGPVEPYTNTFTLQVLDSSGQPVKDATVTLPANNQALGWPYSKNPWMPLHQHGSSIISTVTNNGDGTYAISTYFFMPGLWQIYIVAQTTSVTDSAEYSFCLQ